MTESMKFEQAVEYVMQSKMIAFAFLPKKNENIIKGCELFILEFCEEHENEPEDYPEYNLRYVGGYYYDSSGEEDSYWPEEITNKVKALPFYKSFERQIESEYEVQITLKQLNGIHFEGAKFDADCKQCERSILETGRLSLCEECSSRNH